MMVPILQTGIIACSSLGFANGLIAASSSDSSGSNSWMPEDWRIALEQLQLGTRRIQSPHYSESVHLLETLTRRVCNESPRPNIKLELNEVLIQLDEYIELELPGAFPLDHILIASALFHVAQLDLATGNKNSVAEPLIGNVAAYEIRSQHGNSSRTNWDLFIQDRILSSAVYSMTGRTDHHSLSLEEQAALGNLFCRMGIAAGATQWPAVELHPNVFTHISYLLGFGLERIGLITFHPAHQLFELARRWRLPPNGIFDDILASYMSKQNRAFVPAKIVSAWEHRGDDPRVQRLLEMVAHRGFGTFNHITFDTLVTIMGNPYEDVSRDNPSLANLLLNSRRMIQ